MKLIYRLLQEFRLFRKLDRWWYIYWFERRWRQVYRDATPIEGIPNLYVSVCDPQNRLKLGASFARVWNRIPAVNKETLQQHWHHLQRTWDGRNTGIPLHLPVISQRDRSLHSGDRGAFAALATISGLRGGLDVSPDGDIEFFASIFLLVSASSETCSDDQLDLGVVRTIASYLLWLLKPNPDARMFGKFIHGYHDDNDELVMKWSFATSLETEQNNR